MEKKNNLNSVELINLNIINNKNGNILHYIKSKDPKFIGFGEVYFTFVNYLSIKGWKKHLKMSMNLVVPVGNVKFVFYDEINNNFNSHIIGEDNYQRLYVPPNIWFAFQGIEKANNLVANFSNIVHDEKEAINKTLDQFDYNWEN